MKNMFRNAVSSPSPQGIVNVQMTIGTAAALLLVTLTASADMTIARNALNADSFGFATWNVGHFSLGRKRTSVIAAADVPAKAAAYQAFLKSTDASVLGVCEHSAEFSADGKTRAADTAFADFPGNVSGPVHGAHANAVYWKDAELVSSGFTNFPVRHAACYCQWARLRLKGREVCFVETHCDWFAGPGHEFDRLEQILFLAKLFKDEPRVVIAGDFNTCVRHPVTRKWEDAPGEFAAFRVGGYEAAHWGGLMTWPADAPYLSIDNIFVRGLKLGDVKVLPDPALSDHALVRCTLEF